VADGNVFDVNAEGTGDIADRFGLKKRDVYNRMLELRDGADGDED
jgi:hypothetical protein